MREFITGSGERFLKRVMKSVITSLAIIVFAVGSAAGLVKHSGDGKSEHGVERILPADANVTVTLCAMAGQITVRGWNKNEVRARSVDAEQIELKRIDVPGEPAGLARKIDVFIDDKSDERRARGDCQASADVDLDVPQGATVQIQTQNGDISIEHVSQKIEVGSIGGSISVKDSSGRVTLTTAGGGIEATNINPLEGDDNFDVTSVSGDIQLEKVGHAKLTAKSVTGNINLLGSLAHNGNYGFNTMSGDVTLSLPADASFRLVAKLAQDGEVITDFPLTLTTETLSPTKSPKSPPTAAHLATPAPSAPAPSTSASPSTSPKATPEKPPAPATVPTIVRVAPVVKVTPSVMAVPYLGRRIVAVHGSGDASINVASFSGTIHLQKN